jgi:hypothetical protein
MGLSLWHLIVLAVIAAIWGIPLYAILGRIGWSRGWTFVALVPPLAMVLLWAIAFGRWNSVDIDKLRDGIRG